MPSMMMTAARRTAGRAARAATLLALAACGAERVAPLEPTAAPRASVTDGAAGSAIVVPTAAIGLLRLGPQGEEFDRAVIGPAGGELYLRRSGLRVVVPAGAVSGPTPFAVRALPGRVIAYDFQPHGARFAVPLRFEQDVPGAIAAALTAYGIKVEGAHFADASHVNIAAGTAIATEFLPVQLDLHRRKLIMSVPHFSGYMMSTGRQALNED
jgi:hypothetical protein